MRRIVFTLAVICLAAAIVRSVPAAAAQAAAGDVTYASSVSGLLATHCTACHHAGGPAPFSLTSFEDAASRARQLADAVENRRMPRWKAEPGFGGPFTNERRLSDAEVAVFTRWADAGAPRGSDEHVHLEGAEHGAWHLGTPDLVVSLPEPYVLQPGRRDVFRNFAIRLPLGTARLVRGIEFIPDNHVVTHHANIRVDPTANSTRLDARDPGPGYEGIASPTAVFPDGYFLGWTPGQGAVFQPDGLAWKLASGSSLAVELHMVPTTVPEAVNFRVGLYFTDRPPVRTPVMLRLGRQDLDIPAGASAYVVRDEFTLPVDAELMSLQPHAHYLAREVKGRARLPDGSRRWLIYIKDWEFHVQDVYRLAEPMLLPKGTVVQMEYTYDNSAANPHNPSSPPVRVRWGQYTSDEMGDLWLQLLPARTEDLAVLNERAREKALAEDIVGYRALLDRNPSDALLHANIAGALILTGKRKEALEHLRAHARLEPDSAIAFYNMGTALAATAEPDEALDAFRRAADLEPDPLTYNGIGGVLLNAKGDLPGALAAFQKAVALDPRYANAFNNIGVTLERMGRPDGALGAYLAAAELDAESVDARFNAAGLLESHRQYEAALRLYREAAALQSADRRVQLRLAWVLATAPAPIGNPAEAEQIVRTVLRARDDDPEVFDTLAAAQAASGRYRDAATSARKALLLLEESGDRAWREAIELRLALYRRQRPYVAPPP